MKRTQGSILALALAVFGTQLSSQGEPPQEPVEQEQPAQDEPTPVEEAPAPVEEAVLLPAPEEEPVPVRAPGVFDRALSVQEIDASCAELVSSAAPWVRLESLGESAAGRSIPLLVLTDHARGEAGSKPALFVAGSGNGRGEHGAEAALATAWGIAQAAATTPELAELLAVRTLYVAPMLDPDARAEPAGAAGVRFDRSFPMGWRPARLRVGSGDVPLENPAARAVHAFLEARENVVLVLTCRGEASLDGSATGLWPGAELPAEDARVLAELAARAPRDLVVWPRVSERGGGLLDHAVQGRGIFAAAIREPQGLDDGEALGAWTGRARELSLELLGALPSLSLEGVALERLAPGIWQLDAKLSNRGLLPSSSALARSRVPGVRLRTELAGGRIVASAQRSPADSAYQLEGSAARALLATPLLGGESRWLRFVVEAQAGEELVISSRSPWCGEARASVLLPVPAGNGG